MSATTRHEKLRALAIRCEEQRKLISGLAVENAALNEEVERLRELTRWIPVSERLPELSEMVETFGAYDAPAVCWYRGKWVNCYDTTLDMSGVTHWRYIVDRNGMKGR
jgi:hypothetical protein